MSIEDKITLRFLFVNSCITWKRTRYIFKGNSWRYYCTPSQTDFALKYLGKMADRCLIDSIKGDTELKTFFPVERKTYVKI